MGWLTKVAGMPNNQRMAGRLFNQDCKKAKAQPGRSQTGWLSKWRFKMIQAILCNTLPPPLNGPGGVILTPPTPCTSYGQRFLEMWNYFLYAKVWIVFIQTDRSTDKATNQSTGGHTLLIIDRPKIRIELGQLSYDKIFFIRHLVPLNVYTCRILVHGCDGTDQSAAVVIAAIMQYKSATLEVGSWQFLYSR